jgi:hypothetical protein
MLTKNNYHGEFYHVRPSMWPKWTRLLPTWQTSTLSKQRALLPVMTWTVGRYVWCDRAKRNKPPVTHSPLSMLLSRPRRAQSPLELPLSFVVVSSSIGIRVRLMFPFNMEQDAGSMERVKSIKN